jgi:hypothetical protein
LTRLPFTTRAAHAFQREVGRLFSIVWVLPIAFILGVLMRYHVRDVAQVRTRYRALVKESDRPLLICPNHLTMMDSAIIAWALGGSWWYLFHYSRIPWNLPEYNNSGHGSPNAYRSVGGGAERTSRGSSSACNTFSREVRRR